METAKEAARRLAAPMIAKGYKPVALHPYTDPNGEITYYRIRLKHPESGHKWIRPLHLSGTEWELREPELPAGKPLYRLHELAANLNVPCWYVEGENCVDALAKLGVLTTTAGAASSDERTDFAPLAGRTVTIWPDNDKPGVEHAARVATKLQALGCDVETIDVRALELEKGGDVVDWLLAHGDATGADLAELRRVRPDAVPPEDDAGRLLLRCVAEIEARPVRWLWPGRIARGKVSLLAGHPRLGKSQVCASLAAIVTTGGMWPVDSKRCERGAVLIFSAEDDPEDTIRPRLEAAGADLSRCHVLDAVQDRAPDGRARRRGFSFTKDLPQLSAALADLPGVALVIIDPVTAYLGDTDTHNNADVRAVLAALSEVAAKHMVAIVAVSHLRKSGAGDALLQVTGSLGFVAAARAAYVIVKDQNTPQRRLMLPIKNNLGEDETGYAFTVLGARLPNGIDTSRVVWEADAVAVTADEALAPAQVTEERDAVTEAADFLQAFLAEGPMAVKRVYAEGKEAGHSERAIRRAQKQLGIQSEKRGMREGWQWRLPPKAAKMPEDGQEETLDAFDDLGRLRGYGDASAGGDDGDSEVV